MSRSKNSILQISQTKLVQILIQSSMYSKLFWLHLAISTIHLPHKWKEGFWRSIVNILNISWELLSLMTMRGLWRIKNTLPKGHSSILCKIYWLWKENSFLLDGHLRNSEVIHYGISMNTTELTKDFQGSKFSAFWVVLTILTMQPKRQQELVKPFQHLGHICAKIRK